MRSRDAFIAASASVFLLALDGDASAQSTPPVGPTALGVSDLYSDLRSFGSFSDFGAFNDYNRGHNTSVAQREHPEYAALGEPVSGFLLYPRLANGIGVTDNVLATPSGKISDEYLEIAPQIMAQSTWSRNTLNVDVGGLFREYGSKSEEDEDGGHLRAAGRIDLVGDSYALFNGDIQQTYEERTDGGFPATAAAPIPYTTYGVAGRGVYQEGRVRASASLEFRNFQWDAVPQFTQDGGGFLSQGYRNESVTTVAGRGEYAPTPDMGVFGVVECANADYEDIVGSPSRSSQGYRFLAGSDFDLTALLRGEIGLGYVNRQYNSSVYGSISGVAVRGQVEYFPTPLTTLTFNVSRSIQDAVIQNSGGYFSNVVGAKVDHELLRNLILSAAVTYEYDAYNQISRDDQIANFRLSFQYLLSRSIGVNASYSYSRRESHAPASLVGPQFDINRLFVGLVYQR